MLLSRVVYHSDGTYNGWSHAFYEEALHLDMSITKSSSSPSPSLDRHPIWDDYASHIWPPISIRQFPLTKRDIALISLSHYLPNFTLFFFLKIHLFLYFFSPSPSPSPLPPSSPSTYGIHHHKVHEHSSSQGHINNYFVFTSTRCTHFKSSSQDANDL